MLACPFGFDVGILADFLTSSGLVDHDSCQRHSSCGLISGAFPSTCAFRHTRQLQLQPAASHLLPALALIRPHDLAICRHCQGLSSSIPRHAETSNTYVQLLLHSMVICHESVPVVTWQQVVQDSSEWHHYSQCRTAIASWLQRADAA